MAWRPRSLFQLLLLAFVTVIAPLTITVAYSVKALEALAQENSLVSERLIALTRASQILQSDQLDLERSARQYLTLEEESLLELYRGQQQRMLSRLHFVSSLLEPYGESEDVQAIEGLLQSWRATLQQMDGVSDMPLTSDQLELFDRLSQINQSFQTLSQGYVDEVLAHQQQESADIRSSLTWMVTLVVILTLIFGWFFIIWINRPISQIGQEIELLGQGARQRQIRVSGPLEIRQLGDQLGWLQTQLNQLEQEKQRFLRHMSHELKTPLASLREGADLLDEEIAGKLTPQQQEIVEIIQDNSLELQRLVENLLNQNKLQDMAVDEAEQVAIERLVDELVRAHRIAIERRHLSLELKGKPQNWKTDRARLASALENLVSNAVNYSPEREKILISWAVSDDQLVIKVANQGKSIPVEERDKIFQPFYQGSTERQGPIKGSGIGLSVAKECMKRLGGELQLVACQGWSVCFRMELPQKE